MLYTQRVELSELNEQQQAAATHTGGHALVLAGAGSGKTLTLAHRVAWLVEQGVEPWQICTVTFTNRAAGELVERVGLLVGSQADIWAMTFHSLCARMLRIDGKKLGLPDGWNVADRDDSLATIKLALIALHITEAKPADYLRAISRFKNAGLLPDQCPDDEITPVWKEYQRLLRKHGHLDFDDLLLAGRALLQSPAGDRWRSRFRHVLVDEYQDTNPVQEQFLQQFVGEHTTLWAVGDELQVLYRFRLAEVERILKFSQRWSPTTQYPIEYNYRSSAHILEAANAVVKNSQERTDKQLQPTKPPGTPVRLLGCPDSGTEAGEIARYISEQATRKGASSCAVLYRQHDQSRAIEHELRKRGVPYRVLGGTSFYARAEVKHARALLQLLANGRDSLAATRILLLQAGVGPSSVEKLNAWSIAQNAPMSEVMYAADKLPGLPKKVAAVAGRIGQAYAHVRTHQDMTLLEAYRHLRKAAGLVEWAQSQKEKPDERVANLSEFENVLAEYSDSWQETIGRFLESSALEEGDTRGADGEGVTLTTIHAAKGLEWETVWVAGLEQEFYVREHTDEEDARRLVHVAITRGKSEVVLSYALERFKWGAVTAAHPLWLLKELPTNVQERTISSPGPRARASQTRIPQRQASKPSLSASEQSRAQAWITAKKPPQAQSSAAAVRYPAGAAVSHQKLGKGVVINDTGDKVVVKFNSGTKTLVKSYARLNRI